MRNSGINKVHQLAQNQFRFKLYLLLHLPMALFAGLRILNLDSHKALVSVPFGYRNKNPFRSQYFASLSMAAEMASGILALAEVSNSPVPVSMLVLSMRAEFIKKAKTKVIFECNEGMKISQAIAQCLQTKEGVTVELLSVGKDAADQVVAKFWFVWTFKPKKQS